MFSRQVLTVFGLLPVWVPSGFLAYADIRHAMLVLDLRRARLGIALVAGLVGIWTGNLAYTSAAALTAEHAPRFVHMLGRLHVLMRDLFEARQPLVLARRGET